MKNIKIIKAKYIVESDRRKGKAVKKPYIPIKSCPVCGKKSTSVWYGQRGIGTKRQCSFCDFEGDWTNEKISVNEAWNNAVEKYLKDYKEVK